MAKILKLNKFFTKLSDSAGINAAFTLIEVIIGVSLFSVFIVSIIWGFITLVKLEVKSKQKIYEHIQKTNQLSEEYYIKLK